MKKVQKKTQVSRFKRPQIKKFGDVAALTRMPTADGVAPASPDVCLPYKATG